jgi:hypothetical protein
MTTRPSVAQQVRSSSPATQEPHRFGRQCSQLLRRGFRAARVPRELRDVLLHTGYCVPAGRPPQPRCQSALAVCAAGRFRTRLSQDARSILGIDLPELRKRPSSDAPFRSPHRGLGPCPRRPSWCLGSTAVPVSNARSVHHDAVRSSHPFLVRRPPLLAVLAAIDSENGTTVLLQLPRCRDVTGPSSPCSHGGD